jgi:hypothetical protein
MNDWLMIGGIFTILTVAIMAFVAYGIYGGVNASLCNAKKGEVYNFMYEQPLHGNPERFMAKVLTVNIMTDEDIRRLNNKSRYRRNDPEFCRTKHLITAQTADGKVRNFYAERTTKCKRPILAGALFKTGLANFF